MVWLGRVHWWCACIVDAIDVDSGFGRGVSEVQLVSWKTDNSAMCLQKVDFQYHREKDIACNNKLYLKCVAADINGYRGYTQCNKRPVIYP